MDDATDNLLAMVTHLIERTPGIAIETGAPATTFGAKTGALLIREVAMDSFGATSHEGWLAAIRYYRNKRS